MTERSLLGIVLLVGACGGQGGGDGTTDPSAVTGSGPSATGETAGGTGDTMFESADGTETQPGETEGAPEDEEPTPEHFRECEGPPSGAVVPAGPDDYREQLEAMQPGDVLQLAAGTYEQGPPISGMNGEPGSCLVIEGPAQGAPAVFTGSSARNTVAIRDSSYVVVRNLELDGRGELGDAVKAEGDDSNYAHHIVIEGLYIHDHAANQQVVGISTKCPAWDWVIRDNWIETAGTGLYLGDSTGAAPFVSGLIEHNVVLDTTGYNMQIKHQNPRPDVPGLSAHDTTIIRHNVFSKQGGAPPEGARPNLLLGHWPLSGSGVDDQYVVYGNFFHDNPTEALMQVEGNVAIYANVLFNPSGSGLNVQPHNDVPRRIDVFRNTFVTAGRSAGISSGDAGFVQRFVGNAAFGDPALEGGESVDDTVAAFGDATAVLVDPAGVLGSTLDLHPQAGQLADGVDDTGLDLFPWSHRDFDGRPHDGGHRGAYAGPAAAGAWVLDRSRKP